MPLYTYRCEACGGRMTATRKIADRHAAPDCCGPTHLVITAVGVIPPAWNVSYFCQALGQPITSMRQRQQIMKERDLVDARELGSPNWERMQEQATAVKAAAQDDLPQELERAMHRQGLANVL